MNEEVLELYNKIKIHLINTNKFKTDFIGIFIITELNRDNVTKNALIPAILKRGTENLRTMKDISIELENMYGSVFDASSDKMGDKQALQLYITSISNEYALDNENLLDKSIDLICDVIIKPKTENGIFDETYFKQEKENLKKLIESKINDKGAYAQNRCIEEMYKEEPYGLYKYGYIEDLENISNEELFNQYKYILSTSEIHIYISGNFEKSIAYQKFKERFKNIRENSANSRIF